MGMISFTSPKANDTFTAVVVKQGEPAVARIPVSETCTDGNHGISISLYASGAKDPTESVTANGTSWQSSFTNIAVGTYKLVATCTNDKGGQETATVDPITVQK